MILGGREAAGLRLGRLPESAGPSLLPGAIADAVEDALAPLGVRVTATWLTPGTIASLIRTGEGAAVLGRWAPGGRATWEWRWI